MLNFHRHNKPTQGGKFAIGASDGEELIGVVIVGRPITPVHDDGFTAEVTRCCVNDWKPIPNACSFLYGAAWRAAKAMGYTKIITYTLQEEGGASLRGAGWKVVAEVKPHRGWGQRPGREWQPIYGQLKFRWEAS